jgi:hypothetical protein
MSTDYRAELQRLVEAYDEHGGKWPDHHEQALFQAVEDARAALAQPEPEAPAIQPVPVSERLPRPEDCDAEGRCYGWDGNYWWMVGNPGAADETITHWLPANALPTPEATNV